VESKVGGLCVKGMAGGRYRGIKVLPFRIFWNSMETEVSYAFILDLKQFFI
jgi:hypothetical protein